eukprot:GEZU01027707.1.p1 GENE.GEZU01027707.1~~GEZU01027707.1.p1  ORF type:complete len:186 (+),score=22.02 GEZU01027707.1:607-1164(+)
MSVYVLKGRSPNPKSPGLLEVDVPLEHKRSNKRGTWPRYYVTTTTGYVNHEVWVQVIHEYVKIWNLHHPGLHCYLFVDQLGSHIDSELSAYAFARDVHLWFLARYSSHFLQVADSYPFAQLKKQAYVRCAQAISDAIFEPEHNFEAVWNAIYTAERDAFNTTTVRAAFKDTGYTLHTQECTPPNN